MNAKYYGARDSAPKPPDDIWHELGAAGKAGDQARIDLAASKYREWLRANGYYVPPRGSQKPEGVES